jgi:hypothetical protein
MHMDIWIKLVENLKFRTNIEPFKVEGFKTVIQLKPTQGSESNDKLHTEKRNLETENKTALRELQFLFDFFF